MKFLLSLCMLATLAFASYEGDVTADEAFEMQKNGEAIIVDVRTTVEFIYTGHGQGFINIPAFYWTYEPKPLKTRVHSATYEKENDKIKDHVSTMKLYNAKELKNENFVKEVMEAMKLSGVDKVVLVCRSGPRSSEAASQLAQNGIRAFNMLDGFTFGWKEDYELPWGGH